jgi:5-formyltetrahydrofolate cyclo-ligase
VPTNAKPQLRSALRGHRQSLTAGQQQRAARALYHQFRFHPVFVRSRAVALYWASDGEIDPHPLLLHSLKAGKRVYLPRLIGNSEMHFCRYRAGDRLQRNRFGIPEPSGSAPLATSQLDLVVTPLVGFDRRGTRLGMGGGYYDRYFKQLGKRQQRPIVVGAAHSFQEQADLPREPWDRKLQWVVTERGWWRC